MKWTSILIAVAAPVALAAAVLAADPAPPQDKSVPPPEPTLPQGTPSEQVSALIQQHEEVMAAFWKLRDAAKTDVEKAVLFSERYPDSTPYAGLLLQIAEQNPKDPAAVDALLWVMRNGRRTLGDAEPPCVRAKRMLVRDHLKGPKAGTFCLLLELFNGYEAETVPIIRQVLADNPNKEARAKAAFALAKALRNLVRAGKAAAAANQEAEELLDRITQDKDSAAVSLGQGKKRVTLGELADRELFEVRNLLPGQPAPDISGEDVDGKPMKLSDFRGRVVLLEFWGHW